MEMERPELSCIRCGRLPNDIPSCVAAARMDNRLTPEDFVWFEEGTLNTRRPGNSPVTTVTFISGCPWVPNGTRWVAGDPMPRVYVQGVGYEGVGYEGERHE